MRGLDDRVIEELFPAAREADYQALLEEAQQLDTGLRAARSRKNPPPLRGRTWVTRTGVHVDRIASAWIVRGFHRPQRRLQVRPREGL